MDLKNRKFLKVICLISCCIFVTMGWISAAWGTELYIPTLKGEPGQAIEIPIMIDQVDNLAGVKLVMKYDAKILEFKTGSKTRHTDSLMHIINDKKPGLLIIVMAGARGIKGKEFPIFNLTFNIREDLRGNHTTKVEITEIQLMSDKLKDIKCSIKVNPITILSCEKEAPRTPSGGGNNNKAK